MFVNHRRKDKYARPFFKPGRTKGKKSIKSVAYGPGQFFIQAQQRMHRSVSVSTESPIEIASVGHTLAQVPQTVHFSSSVTGETAMGRAPLAWYGKLPGISRSIGISEDCSARIFSLIFSPNATASWASSLSGRPFAMGISLDAKECSPMNAPPATGLKPRSTTRFFNSNNASSKSRFPYTTIMTAKVLLAFSRCRRFIASTGRRPP